jgi:hypothetical protein
MLPIHAPSMCARATRLPPPSATSTRASASMCRSGHAPSSSIDRPNKSDQLAGSRAENLPKTYRRDGREAPVAPWARLKVGAGTPPVLTRYGWLVIYHDVSELAGLLRPRAVVRKRTDARWHGTHVMTRTRSSRDDRSDARGALRCPLQPDEWYRGGNSRSLIPISSVA